MVAQHSSSTTDNPFSTWQAQQNNDLVLRIPMTSLFFTGLAVAAAVIHVYPWIKHVYPFCLKIWRVPVERLASLPRRWREETTTNRDSCSFDVAFFASEAVFLLLFPFMLLFPLIVYIGLPVSVYYGTPATFLIVDSTSSLDVWVVFLWILALHGVDVAAWAWMCHRGKPNKSKNKVVRSLGRFGLLLSFLGAVALSNYAKEMQRLHDKIQYVGPVRLSHIAMFYNDGTGDDNNAATTSDEQNAKPPTVFATWTAEYGSSWACPHQPDRWCQVRQSACHHTVCLEAPCSDSAIDLSSAIARECLNHISLNWEQDAAYNSNETFDRKVSPCDDGRRWPSIHAYADCDSCEIFGDSRSSSGYNNGDVVKSLPYAQKLRRMGLPLYVLGCLLFLAAWVRDCWSSLSSSNGRQDSKDFDHIDTNDSDIMDDSTTSNVEGDLELEFVPHAASPES